jgi:hypothetical protein
MSTLKTPDNATLPEPIVSPGRELRRQEARGRKMMRRLKSESGEGANNAEEAQAGAEGG